MIRPGFFLLLLSGCLLHTSATAQSCILNPPTGLYITNKTSCSAELHWQSAASVSAYRVSFKPASTSQWAPYINVGTNTSYQFTGLMAGTKYNFSVFSKCTDGSKSPKVKKSATTLQCSLPSDVEIHPLATNSVSISITASCSYDSVRIRYQTLSSAFTYVSFPPADSFIVNNLSPDTVYFFQVSTCPLAADEWTPADTVQISETGSVQETLPNIILILLDDSRFDYFSCNGAPDFFQSPHIDRIANEGVNFKNSYCVTSLCAPSRATIASGLFTLNTGVIRNGGTLDTNIITVPQVLKNNGYYTALVGKNHGTFLNRAEPEFNYYLWSLGIEKNAGIKFNYNGNSITINKNNSLTLTDTAIAIINRVNQPLFLWLAYQAPHFPLTPLPSFAGRYDNYIIPWLPDTAKYTVNYPSSIYSPVDPTLHGLQMDTAYRQTLEVIAQLDSCVGEIINALEATGKLDSTLLIFTNDNGYMLGNHWIQGKTYPYEASARTPLFIRFPKWFADSSIITDQYVSNMDLAPTMYDAARIAYPIAMDGFSLKKIYDGEISQNQFYYIMIRDSTGVNPTARAIRDRYFKYIHYTCTDSVEEFFDMVNDPLELTNLINNSTYAAIIETYRNKLDSVKVARGDAGYDVVRPCHLENPTYLKQMLDENESLPGHPLIYPTLMTEGNIEIYIPWENADATLFDERGRIVSEWKIFSQFSGMELPSLEDGMYLLHLQNGERFEVIKLMVAQ